MGLDEKNQAYNINADTAAGALATSLRSRRLLLMTDVEGVYDENKKLISEIKPSKTSFWKDLDIQRCSKGILNEKMPFIEFDEEGVSNYSKSFQPIEKKPIKELEIILKGGVSLLLASKSLKIYIAFNTDRSLGSKE